MKKDQAQNDGKHRFSGFPGGNIQGIHIAEAKVEHRMGADLADQRQSDQQHIIVRGIAQCRSLCHHHADAETDPAGQEAQEHIRRSRHSPAHLIAYHKIKAHEHCGHKSQNVSFEISRGQLALVKPCHQNAAQQRQNDSHHGPPSHMAVEYENRHHQHHKRVKRRQHHAAGDIRQLDGSEPAEKMAEQKRPRSEGPEQILLLNGLQLFPLVQQHRNSKKRHTQRQPPEPDSHGRR